MPFEFVSLGEKELKGFDHAVHVYRVELASGESVPAPIEAGNQNAPPGNRRLIAAFAAVILVAVFSLLGSVLQGHHVMKTLGKGIVKTDLDFVAIIVALICSGFFVTLATFFRIPTSTSQAIVGGVVGIGLAVGAEINYSMFLTIVGSWIICPILVIAFSFSLSYLLRFILKKIRAGAILVQNALGWLAIFSACYVAYSMGANNAGNAVGTHCQSGNDSSHITPFHRRRCHCRGGYYIWEKGRRYGRQRYNSA